MLIQGREITLADITSIGRLIDANPSWNPTRLPIAVALPEGGLLTIGINQELQHHSGMAYSTPLIFPQK
ncbi:hypothetical protein M1O20_06120 [Dehalococcoidia bacterium]|nr:hypothetical protein [Dehalococcoidia bacterium]MCL0084503.1 hypothetical protein [Dehalococcoidia bacterium]